MIWSSGILLANVVVVLEAGFLIHSQESKYERGVSDVEWDHFMIVTEWPQSTCEYINSTHQHECVIPSVVKGWVLHGLWPSSDEGQQPYNCHDWKFDFSKVQDLEDDLKKYWPNLFSDTSDTNFWAHEYEKHGTCAASVPYFTTEHDFFKRTLELREKYDIKRVLDANNIAPNEEGYDLSVITDAISKGFNVTTCIECSHVHGLGQVMSAGYICLSKQLELIHCNYCKHRCRDYDTVYYHPLHYNYRNGNYVNF